ncbi:protein A4 [Aotine betaherpesvirus 1]|uniref:Protein A4 n=1 Tax=Aotine betaherpesvirus 1 TaxID=50290 RepID=G8XU77_9BETA|nr:protein A4 [Aotine betaherpesvirus 1]AEV80814.1 protein A4 [Aotine betaherpesvirus 1]
MAANDNVQLEAISSEEPPRPQNPEPQQQPQQPVLTWFENCTLCKRGTVPFCQSCVILQSLMLIGQLAMLIVSISLSQNLVIGLISGILFAIAVIAALIAVTSDLIYHSRFWPKGNESRRRASPQAPADADISSTSLTESRQ